MKHGKERKIIVFLLLFSIITLVFLLISLKNSSSSDDMKEESLSVVYFHNIICESCNEDMRFINLFNTLTDEQSKDIPVNFKIYNIYLEDGDYMFNSYCDEYGIPEEKRLAPIVFIGNSHLIGESQIENSMHDVFMIEKENILNKNQ